MPDVPATNTDHHHSPVPAAVKAAAERAEALLAGQHQQPPPADGDANPPPAAAEAPPEPPVSSSVAPAAAPAPEAPPQGETLEAAQQRYKRAEGRVDALTRQVTEANSRLQNLERVMASLQAGVPVATPAPGATPAPAPNGNGAASPGSYAKKRYVTDEEETDYGKDLLDVVRRAAREVAEEVVAPVDGKIGAVDNKVGSIGTVMAKDATTAMFRDIASLAPEAPKLNKDKAFLGWLQETDPYSGEQRQAMLDRAAARHDAQTVANFFLGYQRELAATGQAPQTDPATTPASSAPGGKVPLTSLVAPGKPHASGGGPASAPQAKAVYSRGEITQFYTDKAAGKWRGREADFNRIEADIFAAQAEGRVRP